MITEVIYFRDKDTYDPADYRQVVGEFLQGLGNIEIDEDRVIFHPEHAGMPLLTLDIGQIISIKFK